MNGGVNAASKSRLHPLISGNRLEPRRCDGHGRGLGDDIGFGEEPAFSRERRSLRQSTGVNQCAVTV